MTAVIDQADEKVNVEILEALELNYSTNNELRDDVEKS